MRGTDDADGLTIRARQTALIPRFPSHDEMLQARANPQAKIAAMNEVPLERAEKGGERIRGFNPHGLSGGPMWTVGNNCCKLNRIEGAPV